MEVTFEKKSGKALVDNAIITHKHFSGKADNYHRTGERDFSLILTSDEVANAFIEQGYNVKIKAPKIEGEEPFRYLSIRVKFNNMGPSVYLNSAGTVRKLNEDTIEILDNIALDNIDLTINPSDWNFNGKSGRTAYLQDMDVTQKIFDRFADRYRDMF